MSESDDTTRARDVRCGYCEEWLPADEAVSPEGDDYALYFCGLECHAAWLAEQAAEVEHDFEAHSGVTGHHHDDRAHRGGREVGEAPGGRAPKK